MTDILHRQLRGVKLTQSALMLNFRLGSEAEALLNLV